MLKGKIHRATVTQAELDYVGSYRWRLQISQQIRLQHCPALFSAYGITFPAQYLPESEEKVLSPQLHLAVLNPFPQDHK